MEPIKYILFFIKVMVQALIGKAIDMLFKLFLSMALPTNLEDTEQDVDTAEEDVDTMEEVGSVSVNPWIGPDSPQFVTIQYLFFYCNFLASQYEINFTRMSDVLSTK